MSRTQGQQEFIDERFRLTLAGLDHMDQGMTVIDEHLRLITCNRRFLELLEFPDYLAEPGTHFSEFIRHNALRGEYGPGDPEQQVSERVRKAEDFSPHCFQRVRPDGTIIEIRGQPMACGGFVSLYSDITERVRAERELEESRARLEQRVAERTVELAEESEAHQRTAAVLRDREQWIRLITDAVPVVLAYIGADGRYRFANRRHREWYGLGPEHLIGGRFGHQIDVSVYRDFLREHIELALAGKSTSVEIPLRDPKGRKLEILYTFIPHRGENEDGTGEVLGFFALGQDMTERNQVQAMLHRAQKMEAVGQLTGGVAHDFNNLLTIIMGNLAFLEEDLDDPLLAETAQTAMGAAERGAALTGRLLAFSRRQPLAPQTIDPLRLLAEIRALLRRTLGEGIDIVARVVAGCGAIHADPGQLENALLNLAINARDAMPGGGRLTIAAGNCRLEPGCEREHPEASPGDYVLISVTDEGCGMSEELIARAVEPFFTTKGVGQGTGLGLSMAYGFARQSGGHLRIISQPGSHTRIELYLPRPANAQAASASGNRHSDGPPRGDEPLLLVEDDPEVRRYSARVLSSLGYRVVEAGDAAEALSLLESLPETALLVTDMLIPGGMLGGELAEAAQQARPGLRVLCVSGYAKPATEEESTIGRWPLLRKPFSPEQLARAVRDALDQEPIRDTE